MFKTLKRWADVLTVKTRDLFNSPKSEIYIKDLRKVITHKDGRKCKYPKNYDEIVKFGKIIDRGGSKKLRYSEEEDANKKENEEKKLPEFDLTLVEKDGQPYVTHDNKSYYTIDFLIEEDRRKIDDYSAYYEPFGFSKIDLEKHIPVLEFDRVSGKLTNSSLLTKEVKENGKVKKVVDPNGRNGEVLYTSEYKKLNPDFFEIRDHNGNLELDKSLLSVPLAFIAYLVMFCTECVTYIPTKLGKSLINTESKVAKFVGGVLFIPAAAVKHLVNFLSTILRFPILLFVADKEKYGDSYLTMWKHQFKKLRQEVKDDIKFIKNGEREKRVEIDYPEFKAGGTWKELNATKTVIEAKLEEYEKDPEKYRKKYNDIQKSRELIYPALDTSEGKGETISANPPTPTPTPVAAGQNTSSQTSELGDSSNKQGSYADVVKKSRRASQSNTTTLP